jgi:hypothetical protein
MSFHPPQSRIDLKRNRTEKGTCPLPEMSRDKARRSGIVINDPSGNHSLEIDLLPGSGGCFQELLHIARINYKLACSKRSVLAEPSNYDNDLSRRGIQDARHDAIIFFELG